MARVGLAQVLGDEPDELEVEEGVETEEVADTLGVVVLLGAEVTDGAFGEGRVSSQGAAGVGVGVRGGGGG